MVEKTREVFLASCAEMAQSLAADGYRYLKTGHYCKKTAGELGFEVRFGTSRYNQAGTHICLDIGAIVTSQKVGKWRAAYPLLRQSDGIAGGLLGTLRSPSKYLEWELANPATRPQVIADALKTIREVALPYFALFENLDILIPRIIFEEIPRMDIEEVIAFLVCFADQATARSAAIQFFHRCPYLIPDYRKNFEILKDPSIERPYFGGSAPNLALISHQLGFGDLTTGFPF